MKEPKPDTVINPSDQFRERQNCHTSTIASHARMLIDCVNFYRALHQALSKARHSIFITGWDIDSRIELIRREEDGAHEGVPRTLYDLLTQKAAENPDLKIYLNRWNYAFFMAGMREPLAVWRWKGAMLPNIHYCRDNMTPAWACHHQKIIVVDDEVAFVGGMDVAVNRWDDRAHSPGKSLRVDPGGVYNPFMRKEFEPYHDIQMVVAGDAARALAIWVRERWRRGAGYDALPVREQSDPHVLPQSWPDNEPADFVQIPVAVALTMPPFAGREGLYQIERLYLDQIALAQEFIYIENQYLARDRIAIALRRRLEENTRLRVLLVSSYDPQGWMEKISMWTARVRFQNILSRVGIAERVTFAYPLTHEDGISATTRIHSKLMIVDDRFLHIGSANINNRSMRMDTECDLCFEAANAAHRAKIKFIRNDLIREHTGYEEADIQAAIAGGQNPSIFLKRLSHSTQHLIKINDRRFFKKRPPDIRLGVTDPVKNVLPELPVPPAADVPLRIDARRKMIGLAILFALLCASAFLWKAGYTDGLNLRGGALSFFDSVRESPLAVPVAMAFYALAALLFAPVTVLSAVAVLAFGPGAGFLIALCGAMMAAMAGYALGRMTARDKIIFLTRTASEKIKSFAHKTDVTAIALLRLVPLAPFTAVNLALGMAGVPAFAYVWGTLLGFLPGTAVIIFVTGAFQNLWMDPGLGAAMLAASAILAWSLLVWGVHMFHARWRQVGAKAPARAA